MRFLRNLAWRKKKNNGAIPQFPAITAKFNRGFCNLTPCFFEVFEEKFTYPPRILNFVYAVFKKVLPFGW